MIYIILYLVINVLTELYFHMLKSIDYAMTKNVLTPEYVRYQTKGLIFKGN